MTSLLTPDQRERVRMVTQQLVYARADHLRRWKEICGVLQLDSDTTTQAELLEVIQTMKTFIDDL